MLTIVTGPPCGGKTTHIATPLGPGHFHDGDDAWVVFATEVNADSRVLKDIASVPFVAQEILKAVRHYRVVTVGDRAWGAVLDARDLPVDWRAERRAHTSFRETALPDEVRSGALRIAGELQLGYSSQDWLETDSRCVLLDVNPGGQWLFLPEPVSDAVSRAIADWLRGDGGA